MVWYSHLFKNFPQFGVIHTVKGFKSSQWSRCFSGILLLFLWSKGCWQLDLWFLWLFFLVLPVYCYQPTSLHPRAHMLSHVIPWTSACQTPLSMDFSRQEYWSGLPFPSPSSGFSKSTLNIWKFSVNILMKPSLKDFEHYFASLWNECNCALVWIFFGTVLLWDWNENWPFPVLWPLRSFQNLLVYWVRHFHSIIF